MNRDDIIRMAEEAGIPTTEVVIRDNGTCLRTVNVERFAALVAKAEREACANILDCRASAEHVEILEREGWSKEAIQLRDATLLCSADYIRARGEE